MKGPVPGPTFMAHLAPPRPVAKPRKVLRGEHRKGFAAVSDEIAQLAQTVPRGLGEAVAHGCDVMTPNQVCEGEKPPPIPARNSPKWRGASLRGGGR